MSRKVRSARVPRNGEEGEPEREHRERQIAVRGRYLRQHARVGIPVIPTPKHEREQDGLEDQERLDPAKERWAA